MPVEKELTKLIPRIYKYNYENIGLFFFVKGQQKILPTVSLTQAINNYFKFAGISQDDWDILSATTTYNKMQKDFYQCKR
jgi:hypothetical protein